MEKEKVSLAAARLDCGFTLAQVAAACDVAVRTVLAWERRIEYPSIAAIQILEKLYKRPYYSFKYR